MQLKSQSDKKTLLNNKILQVLERSKVNDLVIGYLRFEAIRKLNGSQYVELLQRNLARENFDKMIDDLIIESL